MLKILILVKFQSLDRGYRMGQGNSSAFTWPYSQCSLPVHRRSRIVSLNPCSLSTCKGLWVDSAILSPLRNIDTYRIVPQRKKKEGCWLCGNRWLIFLASISSIVFDKMRALS